MKILLLSAALLFSSLILCSCKKDNPIPPEDQPQLNLALEDTSCTEAWIKLSAANISLPAEVILRKDDSAAQTIILNSADTLLYVNSLLPNHTYKFQSVIQSINQSSNLLNVTTMDTTSHNFTFETFTFGGTAGSSTLNDVAIINENDIWAVGEIYVADSSQNGYTMYNAVHWDGNQWELKKILYNGNFWVIRTIFAFSENDIWFSAFVRYNGQNFIELPIPNILMGWTPVKIWGSKSNDLYVVGNNGNIVHYQNGQWSRIESGTDLNINDIYGAFNEKTTEYEILAPAANVLQSLDRDLLSITGNSVEHLDTAPVSGTLRTCWFILNKTYLLGGGGIFRKTTLSDSYWQKYDTITGYSINRVRGTAINNVTLAGGGGELLHYNGYTFKSYINQTAINGNYYSIGMNNNLIVAIGDDGSQAVITLGRRNN